MNSDIDFLYLRGNHDEGVNFADNDNIPNLKRFSKEKWTKYSYGNVDIYGHEFEREIPVSVYSEQFFEFEKINILVLHGQIVTYKAKDGAPEILLPELRNRNIDYVALGHIHEYRKEKLDNRGEWCYSGCLEGRGFDECGEKGFVFLDINDITGRIETQFIPYATRHIREIEVPLNGTMDYHGIMGAIKEKIQDISSSDIVRVVLTGDVSEYTKMSIDESFFKKEFLSSFYFVDVKDDTRLEIDYKNYENDISLKGEFVRLVKEQPDLSEDEKLQVLITGIKALQGGISK